MKPRKERWRSAGSKDTSDSRNISRVNTVHVAISILDAVAEFGGPARISDIARVLGMTMPTVSRHVSTWRELGFLEKTESQESYRLGAKLFSLGQAAAEQNDHVSVAYPHLIALRDEIHETIMLCTRVQEDATALVCLESGQPTTLMVRPGAVFRIPYSPTARVLWALADANGESKIDARSWDFSEQPGLNLRTFKAKIRSIRQNFYDYEHDVRGGGIGAVSVPVFEHRDTAVVALTVVFPSGSRNSGQEKKILEPLKRCAAAISAQLGSIAWEPHVPKVKRVR